MRCKWISVIVAMPAAGLVGAVAAAQEDGAAAASGESGAQTQAPLYDPEDLRFLHHMSIHHEQAIVMSARVPERTDRDEFKRFARYVSGAQAAEIELMQSLLDTAAERGLEAPEHAPSGDPPMAGMLSSAEMEALEAASGAEFERRWLEGMIFHHEGALAMARAQQLKQLETGRRPYGFHVLVEDILVEQRAEITKMRAWLDDWGLVSDAGARDSRAPAVGITSPVPGATVPPGSSTTIVGTAVDDTRIASVQIGIQDLSTGEWWHSDGSWGAYAPHPVELSKSGAGSAAWTFTWSPPAAGRYAVAARVEDGAGKRNAAEPRRELSAE